MLHPENSKIIFEVYAAHPVLAVTHAYQLIPIRQSLQRGRKEYRTLSPVCESLYPHTDFDTMGRKYYHRAIEDQLKPDQAEKLRQLGVKI